MASKTRTRPMPGTAAANRPAPRIPARDQHIGSSPATTETIRRGVVAAGLVGIAAVHLADLPGKMAEVPYLGWAYVGLIIASLVLAELIIMRSDRRLMAAAAGLAVAVLLGFVVNRTVGMPHAMDDIGNWTEPLGMVSLLIEGVVLWVGARAWSAVQ